MAARAAASEGTLTVLAYTPLVMLSARTAMLPPLKGRCSVSSSKSSTPSAHTSEGSRYGSDWISSGEK